MKKLIGLTALIAVALIVVAHVGVADSGGIIGHLTSGKTAFTEIKAASTAGTNITFALPGTESNLLGTVVFQSDTTAPNMDDNDYTRYVLLMAYNDQTQKVPYVVMDVYADDVTDTTEDGSAQIKVDVAGTLTTVCTFATDGIDVTGTLDVSGAQTVGGTLGTTGIFTSSSNAVFSIDADVVGDLTAGTVQADNGHTGTVTMQGALMTNVYTFAGGILTGVSASGP